MVSPSSTRPHMLVEALERDDLDAWRSLAAKLDIDEDTATCKIVACLHLVNNSQGKIVMVSECFDNASIIPPRAHSVTAPSAV
jgi:hypothetical protein